MNYLKHLASIFDFEQQLSLQVALQEILSDAIPAVVEHNDMIVE